MLNKVKSLTAVLVLSLSVFVVPAPAMATPIHHPTAIHQVVHKTVHKVHPVVVPKSLVSPLQKIVWGRVNQCEEGGNWNYFTWWYPDGLGIDRPNFIQFGGNPNIINSIAQQILVGQRFIAYYHMAVPDQYGCTGSY